MEALIHALKAAGEPTRLRILAVLAEGELTVTELCQVLGQTQPRVSRHLKLLCEAGLLDRHAQGTSAYYGPTRHGVGRDLFTAVLPLVDSHDMSIQRDRRRLTTIRAERAEVAAEYFERIAADWEQMRGLHVADEQVEAALVHALDGQKVDHLLDIGTGTGRVLEIFADRIKHGIGIDLSQQMLNLARTRLHEKQLAHCTVRHGNVYDLDVEPGSMDVAVLHHVLHFLDDPATAIAQAAQALRPRGHLLIVDFAPHNYDNMRSDYAHHWLGFDDESVATWCENAGLQDLLITHLNHKIETEQESLTVTLWVAQQRPDAPAVYKLEAAS